MSAQPDEIPPIPLDVLPDHELREEWEHFKGFGWSDQKVAERLDLNWHTLLVWAMRWRATGHKPRPSAPRRRERVAELIAAGKTPAEIAEELGVTRHTVTDDSCRLGLTRGRGRLITQSA